MNTTFFKKHFAWSFAILVTLLVISIVVIRFQSSLAPRPARSGLYAVFLTNGQVYFGTITKEARRVLRLENIFYFQLKGITPTEDLSARSDVTIQKLGNEIHGPEDWMEINREQILFIEKLKADGKVAKAIQAYNKN